MLAPIQPDTAFVEVHPTIIEIRIHARQPAAAKGGAGSDPKIYSQRSGLVDCGPYAGSRTLVIVLDLAL